MKDEAPGSRHPSCAGSIEHVLVLATLIGVFCLLFGTTFLASFGVIEEHRVVNDSQRTMREWLATMTLEDILAFGRVRPVYFLFHFGNILLFGPNPHALHLVTTGLGILTCFLFYLAARRIGADIPSALVFVILVIVTGDHGEIWYRLFSPAETFGMPLTAVAVWASVRAASRSEPGAWNAVALIAMALAGLAKESFILIIPALILLRWLLHCWFGHDAWWPAPRKLRSFVVTGTLVFVIEMLLVGVVSLSRPASYGANIAGLSPSSFDPRAWYELLTSPGLARRSVYLLGSGALLLILAAMSRLRAFWPYLLAAVVVAVAWLVPQLVLYRHGIGEHYLFPAIVAPAAFVGLTLSILWHTRHWAARAVWLGAVLSLVPLISRDVAVTTEAASRYTADTLAFHEMVSYLTDNVAARHAIITAADPATPYGFEAIHALHAYMKAADSASPIYLWPVLDPARHTSLHAKAAEATVTEFGYPKTLRSDDIGAIVVASVPSGFASLPSWFVGSQWREVVFRKPYYRLALHSLRYLRIGSVTQRILVPGEEGPGIPTEGPLVTVDASLRHTVGINPLLRTPWWGVEQYASGPLLWLGDGVDGELIVMLWSDEEQPVQVTCEVLAGPAREDSRRTMALTLSSYAGTTTSRQSFDRAGSITFRSVLYRGRNEMKLAVLDTASPTPRPTGDPRSLLVQLRRVTLTGPRHEGPGS